METHKSAQAVYARRVPVPHPDSINTGLSYLRASTCIKLFGHPRLNQDYTDAYQEPDNPTLKALLVTQEVTGLGRVRGLKPAVDSLNRVMQRVRHYDANLLSVLGYGGMLNCRRIRGSKHNTPSNHSWGLAVDLKVDGRYDTVGDGLCFVALLDVYKFFHAEGWYWGGEFSREDSMHFEVAEETLPAMFGEFMAAAKVEAKAKEIRKADAKTVKAVVAKVPASPDSGVVKNIVEHLKGASGAVLRSYLAIEGVPFKARMVVDDLRAIAIAHARKK